MMDSVHRAHLHVVFIPLSGLLDEGVPPLLAGGCQVCHDRLDQRQPVVQIDRPIDRMPSLELRQLWLAPHILGSTGHPVLFIFVLELSVEHLLLNLLHTSHHGQDGLHGDLSLLISSSTTCSIFPSCPHLFASGLLWRGEGILQGGRRGVDHHFLGLPWNLHPGLLSFNPWRGFWPSSICWGSQPHLIFKWPRPSSISWGSQPCLIFKWPRPSSISWGSQPCLIFWGSQPSSILWGSQPSSIFWGSQPPQLFWGSQPSSVFRGSRPPQLFNHLAKLGTLTAPMSLVLGGLHQHLLQQGLLLLLLLHSQLHVIHEAVHLIEPLLVGPHLFNLQILLLLILEEQRPCGLFTFSSGLGGV